MKQFFAFYNSGFDPQLQAQAYADRAAARAAAINKPVASQIVDVTGSSPALKHWSGPNTIECVTVDGGVKKESLFNPGTLEPIDGMIDRL